MFSALIFDREPLRLQDAPAAIVDWLQDMGGWAAFGLGLWLLFTYSPLLPSWMPSFGDARMRPSDRARIPRWLSTSIGLLAGICALAYVALAGLKLVARVRGEVSSEALTSPTGLCLTIGGTAAILAVCLPIFRNLAFLRPRRIWAMARLSFKEAIRSRVLYAFSALLLVILFASWFVPYKPENQVRIYVEVLFWAMPILLLAAAAGLGAFSIPNDIRRQTIHTIVTKPVERFEIFLGRFVGFTGLMTLVLVVMATVSLLYVMRELDPAAEEESLKARDPLYGVLNFRDPKENSNDKGISVGREWDYRSYIARSVPGIPPLAAVWDFRDIPRSLGGRDKVRCEFSLDIYRTTKGQENRGVSCRFVFETAHFPKGNSPDRQPREEAYLKKKSELQSRGMGPDQAARELIREFGYFEEPAFLVIDFHTQSIDVPGALFDKALEAQDAAAARGGEGPAPLQVRVSVNSPSQYVGAARYDLYFRQDDPDRGSDRWNFALNFYKGSAGLWMRLCLLAILALALSTYFSGVISLAVAGVLYICGNWRDFVQGLAAGTAPEGPTQALVRLLRREVGAGFVDDSTATRLALTSDAAFRWVFRRFLDLIPDVERFNLTSYVAEGFTISGVQLLLALGVLVGYVLPWVVLAYYLLRWREVAGPT
jgi:hypothetical protein